MKNRGIRKIEVVVVLLSVFLCRTVFAAPPGGPDFKDEAALRKYAESATLDARLKLYADYFASRPLNAAASRVLGAFFQADLGAATAEKRKALADLAIRTAKTRGLPENSLYDFEAFLLAITVYPDIAPVYYLSLPLGARPYAFDTISLRGTRSAVLASLLPALLPKLSAWTRSQIFRESLKWLDRPDNGYDAAALRAISLSLSERPSSLFAAVEPSHGLIRKPTALDFRKAQLSDKELEYYLPLFFHFTEGDKLEERTTILRSLYGDSKKDAETLALLAAARTSGNQRISALSRYLLLIENNSPLPDAASWPSISSVPATADDWVAFIDYRVAAARGEKLSDDEFLACLDPKRPSLAAAVLEDRFKGEYDDPAAQYMPAGTVRRTSPFEEAVLKKCLTLTGADSDQILVPVLSTLVHLGRARYINSVTFLVRSPSVFMRGFAMQTLLRFADATFYSLFMERLNDPAGTIRVLAIKGLGKIRDSRAVDALARIVGDKEEAEYIRVKAAEALGEIGDRRMIRIFTNILLAPAGSGSSDAGLRLYAAQKLGEQKERTAVDALLRNIDPEQENRLNYYCLEALGKISDTEGFRKLVPILGRAWTRWTEAPDFHQDNFYAAVWALFLYKSAEAEKICSEVFDRKAASYSEAAFVSAFYLARQAATVQQAWLDYCADNRAEFFKDEYRVYQFAVMLEKKWDARSVAWIADGLENYSDNVKTWILSAMYERPSIAFIPKLKAVHGSDDVSVRRWAATVAERVSWLIPVVPPQPSAGSAQAESPPSAQAAVPPPSAHAGSAQAESPPSAQAAVPPPSGPGAELVALVDEWLTTETDYETKRYLSGTATRLAAYRAKAAP